MMKWLGIQNVKPQETPSDVLTPAGNTVELPRIKVVGTRGMAAITESNPPPGMFVVNYDTGRLSQWMGDHWEVVAAHVIGQAPYNDDESRDKNRTPYGFMAAMGNAIGGVGGGGVAPSPGNTQSPTEPVAGGSPNAVIGSGTSGYGTTVYTIAAMGHTDFPIGTVDAGSIGTSMAIVGVGLAFPVPLGLDECQLSILVDGVEAASVQNAAAGHIFCLHSMTNLPPGTDYLLAYRVYNLTAAPFDIRDEASFAYVAQVVLS